MLYLIEISILFFQANTFALIQKKQLVYYSDCNHKIFCFSILFQIRQC